MGIQLPTLAVNLCLVNVPAGMARSKTILSTVNLVLEFFLSLSSITAAVAY